jgi:hypothetical protein
VKATDDFKVASVSIAIYNVDGSLVEQGNAVQQPNKEKWLYTATADNTSPSGDKIVIRAYDLPGNTTEKDETLK